MFNKITSLLCLLVILLGLTVYSLYVRSNELEKERDRYILNTNSLLSDVKRFKIDSARTATDVKVLQLTLDEYKEYRAGDLKIIKQIKAQLKSLQVAAKHELEIAAPISTHLKDTIIRRDTTIIKLKAIELNTPHLKINGIIEENRFNGNVFLPATLNQSVWVEHKHRFLWWRWGVKAIHQTITSDNPHVQIKYSEYIQIGK